jgi:hypothetical protein
VRSPLVTGTTELEAKLKVVLQKLGILA